MPPAINALCSVDFRYYQLSHGRSYHLFNVLNDFNREGLGTEVALPLPAESGIQALNQTIEWRGKPASIRCDNGPEYISGKLAACAEKRGITISFIQPGKPRQNAYIECYKRTVRYDWLPRYLFDSISRSRTSRSVSYGHRITTAKYRLRWHDSSPAPR